MTTGNNKTTIIVAVIGLFSALGVAVISNYDKFFATDVTKKPNPPVSEDPPPVQSPKILYERMNYGFNNCNVQFGELMTGISKDEMIRLATKAGAKGFTYQPSLEYGKVIIGDYPTGCKSPSNMSWPLHLKIN